MKNTTIKLLSFLFLLTIFTSLSISSSVQTYAKTPVTYYVDQSTGDDKFDGQSENQAFKTLQPALQTASAGDTILVKNGTYNDRWGYVFKNSGLPGKYITLKNYPGDNPKLTTKGLWCVFCINSRSYISIQGFEMTNPSVKGDKIDGAGNGIAISNRSHHIIIQNNNIHNVGGAGVGAGDSDYITVDANTIHDTSKQNDWATSGISIADNFNFDNHRSSNYQNIIINNLVYDNEQTRPSAHCCNGVISDGNGIIMDVNDEKNYNGKTLIANNLVVNNGGRGINVFRNSNVDVVNNTLFKNSKRPEIRDGDLTINRSNNVRVYNNLIQGRDEASCGGITKSKNVEYDYNQCFSKAASPFISEHSIEAEPMFASPSSVNVTVNGFKLQASSKAVNAGYSNVVISNLNLTDLAGNPRVNSGKIDIGALEY